MAARTKSGMSLGYSLDEVDEAYNDGRAVGRREGLEAARRSAEKKPRVPATTPAVMEAIEPLPPFMQDVIKEIARTPYVKEGIEMMLLRSADFRNPTAALFAGIMMDSTAHRMFEKGVDEKWTLADAVEKRVRGNGLGVDEVVIGGGFHAADYCAVRVQMGYERPLVLESSPRVGGVFATAMSPTFYLNSRNRPGDSSVPGQPGSLNVVPGAIVQPSDLGGAEYQTDAEMALSIRVALAMNAQVRTNSLVKAIRYGAFTDDQGEPRNHQVTLDDGTIILANRVVLAVGLGKPTILGNSRGGLPPTFEMQMSDRILTYTEFLRRLDRPYPLQGMDRIAVIGAGDSGKTVIEAICGQGPARHGSVASLDWPATIDWYGLDVQYRKQFEECNRSRYKGIGRLLTASVEREFGYDEDEQEPYKELLPVDSSSSRVRSMFRAARGERVAEIVPGYNCVYINERAYDYAIACTGFRSDGIPLPVQLPFEDLSVNGRILGKATPSRTLVAVGPGYPVAVTPMETMAYGEGTPFIRENSSALFRYAQRTAQVAMFLPAPQFVAGFARDDISF